MGTQEKEQGSDSLIINDWLTPLIQAKLGLSRFETANLINIAQAITAHEIKTNLIPCPSNTVRPASMSSQLDLSQHLANSWKPCSGDELSISLDYQEFNIAHWQESRPYRPKQTLDLQTIPCGTININFVRNSNAFCLPINVFYNQRNKNIEFWLMNNDVEQDPVVIGTQKLIELMNSEDFNLFDYAYQLQEENS